VRAAPLNGGRWAAYDYISKSELENPPRAHVESVLRSHRGRRERRGSSRTSRRSRATLLRTRSFISALGRFVSRSKSRRCRYSPFGVGGTAATTSRRRCGALVGRCHIFENGCSRLFHRGPAKEVGRIAASVAPSFPLNRNVGRGEIRFFYSTSPYSGRPTKPLQRTRRASRPA
jgi:hypothetical protein